MKMTVYAPAKINLYLDVMERREDGYHNIKSVMQSVSLSDTVTAELTDDGRISVECDCRHVPKGRTNIAWRAAEKFFQKTGLKNGAKITIEKRIPVQSGLAGGSTDAGAVLNILNSLSGDKLGEGELLELGSSLGADVPFCMTGGLSVCTGVGERLERLKPHASGINVVIARGGDGVSTPAAYRMIDEKYRKNLSEDFGNMRAAADAAAEGDLARLSKYAYNIFESVVLPHHKAAAKCRTIMEQCGADIAMMSGSGPAVFGMFADITAADDAYRYLLSEGISAFMCETQ